MIQAKCKLQIFMNGTQERVNQDNNISFNISIESQGVLYIF